MVKQARAQVTRDAIVQAAGVIFSKTAYSAATLTDIISLAGVTQGSLYFHFDSKLDLALEVVKLQHAKSIALGETYVASASPGLETMVTLSSALAHQMTTDPIVRGGLRLTTESPELFPEYVQEPYTDWISACEQLLGRAAREGDISERNDIGTLAGVVIASFTGVQVVSQAMTKWADLDSRLEVMWQVLLPAIVAEHRLGDVPEIAALSRPSASD